MHDPSLTTLDRAGVFQRIGALGTVERRYQEARVLAELLGGAELLLFAPDPELSVLLPAPGLPQVLRGAARWREFLDSCERDGDHEGTVPGPDGELVLARGIASADRTVAVLMRPDGADANPGPVRPFLPLLGALFRAERQLLSDAAQAHHAAEGVERAKVLTGALQAMRERLSAALIEADRARDEARERAGVAERLAMELQSHTEQLQDQAMELELLNDELATRTEEAEKARATADEANRAKSQFLANMSHELRTPINAVIGYTDLLNLRIAGPVNAGQQAQLERIRVSSQHLLGLVNDVLDLAKVEAGHMTVEHTDELVLEAIETAKDLLEVQAVERGLTLEVECSDADARYVGDRDRVRQILVNLLSNAVKFTKPGGSVKVRCGSTKQRPESVELTGDGPWASIDVMDTGIGIAAEHLTSVFKPFVQAEEGHTRTHEGTGLGLTISRQFARLMGGDVTVASELGVGSTFSLWLPTVERATGALDTSIRVGVVEPAPEQAALAQIGAALEAKAPAVATAFLRRAATELPPAAIQGMKEREILGRVPVLIAEIAATLAGWKGMDSELALSQDGSPVQRLVAEEHGADRGRRGWSAATVRWEFEILRDELISVAGVLPHGSGDPGQSTVASAIARFVDFGCQASLRGRAAALVLEEPESL